MIIIVNELKKKDNKNSNKNYDNKKKNTNKNKHSILLVNENKCYNINLVEEYFHNSNSLNNSFNYFNNYNKKGNNSINLDCSTNITKIPNEILIIKEEKILSKLEKRKQKIKSYLFNKLKIK